MKILLEKCLRYYLKQNSRWGILSEMFEEIYKEIPNETPEEPGKTLAGIQVSPISYIISLWGLY